MKSLIGGSIAVAALIAGPAIAADMPVKAPPPAPVYYDWSGAYVGFSIGGVWAEIDRHYPNLGLIGQAAATYTSKPNDIIYDFHAGFQQQWGSWILGVEAGYSAGFREIQDKVILPTFFAPDLYAYSKITNLFTVGPRLGFAWDRWMIYATGGYAIATIKGQYANGAGVQAFPSLHGSSWNDGWFAGGGLEYMVHKGALVDVVLGAEYQHFDVRDKRAFCFLGAGCTPHQLDFDQGASGDIVRARLTIKTQGWGWAGPWGGPVVAKN